MRLLLSAFLIGVLVSLALFGLMQIMLMGNQQDIKESVHLSRMEFVRLKPEPPKPKAEKPPEKQIAQVQERPLPKKQKSAPPEKKPVVKNKVDVKPSSLKPVMPNLDLPALPKLASGPALNVQNTVVKTSDTEPAGNAPAPVSPSNGVIPLMRVSPEYPTRAANRRMEGWVKVEFTITPDGDVEDAEVVEAQPADVFDSAALRAISKWKFKGKIVNGVAVAQQAVQTMQFKLTK